MQRAPQQLGHPGDDSREIDLGADGSARRPVEIEGAGRRVAECTGSLDLVVEDPELALARLLEAAVVDEVEHVLELVVIEPHAVILAEVEDHPGAAAEVAPRHDVLAERAVEVDHAAGVRHRQRRRHAVAELAQHRALRVGLLAEMLEVLGLEEQMRWPTS